jgi:hypothetical protein
MTVTTSWIKEQINVIAHMGSVGIDMWMDTYIELIDVLEANGIAVTTYCSDNQYHGIQRDNL